MWVSEFLKSRMKKKIINNLKQKLPFLTDIPLKSINFISKTNQNKIVNIILLNLFPYPWIKFDFSIKYIMYVCAIL